MRIEHEEGGKVRLEEKGWRIGGEQDKIYKHSLYSFSSIFCLFEEKVFMFIITHTHTYYQ